jgi:hypothetical protein
MIGKLTIKNKDIVTLALSVFGYFIYNSNIIEP